MTTITGVQPLPCSPFDGSGYVGLVITSGIPTYYKVTGTNLNQLRSVNWNPKNPGTVLFQTRQMILLNSNEGTFMIKVLNNYLDKTDREGRISFYFDNGSTVSFPVKTYGPISVGPLWTPSYEGLITG